MNIKSLFIFIALSSAPCFGADSVLDFTNGVNTVPVVTPTVNGARITFNSSGDSTNEIPTMIENVAAPLIAAEGASATNYTDARTYPLTNATKLIFWGDSLIAGTYAEDNTRTIPWYATNLFLTRNVLFMTNAGLAGRTAWAMSLASTNELAQFAPTGATRTILVGSIGFNDTAYGSNLSLTISAVSNIEAYCRSVGIEFWRTTLHHQQAETDPAIAILRGHFNDWSRTNAGTRLLDWERVSPSWEGVTTDGLHWTTNMNARLARHLYQSLRDVAIQPAIQSGGYYNNLSVVGTNKVYRNVGATMNIEGAAPAIYYNASGGVYTGAAWQGFWNGGFLWLTHDGAAGNFTWPNDYSMSLKEAGLTVRSNVTAAAFIGDGSQLTGITSGTGSTNQITSGFNDTFQGSVTVQSNLTVHGTLNATNLVLNTLTLDGPIEDTNGNPASVTFTSVVVTNVGEGSPVMDARFGTIKFFQPVSANDEIAAGSLLITSTRTQALPVTNAPPMGLLRQDNILTDGAGSYTDSILQFGLNAQSTDPYLPKMIYQIESRFRQSPTDEFLCENVWDFVGTNGLQRRPFGFTVGNTTGLGVGGFSGHFGFADSTGTNTTLQIEETGVIRAFPRSSFNIETNGVGWMKQRNAAGNAYLYLPLYNSSNWIEMPGPIYGAGENITVNKSDVVIQNGYGYNARNAAGAEHLMLQAVNTSIAMNLDAYFDWYYRFRSGGTFVFLNTAQDDYVLFLRENGRIGMSTAGSGSKLNVGGNVTIGKTLSDASTAAPTDGLLVQGSAQFDSVISGNGSGLTNLNGGTLTGSVLNTTNGNVGIGTNSPQAKVHIHGETGTNKNTLAIVQPGTNNVPFFVGTNVLGVGTPMFAISNDASGTRIGICALPSDYGLTIGVGGINCVGGHIIAGTSYGLYGGTVNAVNGTVRMFQGALSSTNGTALTSLAGTTTLVLQTGSGTIGSSNNLVVPGTITVGQKVEVTNGVTTVRLDRSVTNYASASGLTIFADRDERSSITNALATSTTLLITNCVPGVSGRLRFLCDGSARTVSVACGPALTVFTNALTGYGGTNFAFSANQRGILCWDVSLESPTSTNIAVWAINQ